MLRPARPEDAPAVSALLARSYPALLAPDYDPAVLAAALPIITRAQAGLLASGTWFVIDSGGDLLAAGGWTAAPPGGGAPRAGVGHIRHVVTDPAHTRRGLARAVLTQALDQAQAAGMTAMHCLSTRTAVPFYASMGFKDCGPVPVTLPGGVIFPAVAMEWYGFASMP
jgi:GNAT superfamily N-acetyltransferase